MKQKLESLLKQAVSNLKQQEILPVDITPTINIERTRDAQHGDFASNLALVMAKAVAAKPRELAEKIVSALPADTAIAKCEIAGPGFINFFIDADAQYQIIKDIHAAGTSFGKCDIGAGKKVQVEFVSANPTGPLHVGHGRGAAYGSVVANLLNEIGYSVDREYYVNDAGRQMDILALSIWLRYLQQCDEDIRFPDNGYRGDYIREIAEEIHQNSANEYRKPANLLLEDIPDDESQGGDKEQHIDALIERARTLLGNTQYRELFQYGLNIILAEIKDDLAEFGIEFEQWFSERQLMNDGSVSKALGLLQDGGFLYEKDGATWFASSRLGDEKDRVVIRDNGQTTYFASDIAYHMHKLHRGYDKIIDIWGADHHGYIPRVNAAIQALGGNADKLSVLLVQFAVLYRGEEKVQMSTRSGQFVTLRQLRAEVGKDAARFFYVMRRADQHMDFDLKLAATKSNENPVFYVQYAHARVCSVLRELDDKGWRHDVSAGMQHLSLLTETHEIAIISTLSKYQEVLIQAAENYETHKLIHYLRELANDFHTYYNALQFLVPDENLRNARLNLICAVKQVIANGMGLLKVNTPESM